MVYFYLTGFSSFGDVTSNPTEVLCEKLTQLYSHDQSTTLYPRCRFLMGYMRKESPT